MNGVNFKVPVQYWHCPYITVCYTMVTGLKTVLFFKNSVNLPNSDKVILEKLQWHRMNEKLAVIFHQNHKGNVHASLCDLPNSK